MGKAPNPKPTTEETVRPPEPDYINESEFEDNEEEQETHHLLDETQQDDQEVGESDKNADSEEDVRFILEYKPENICILVEYNELQETYNHLKEIDNFDEDSLRIFKVGKQIKITGFKINYEEI